MQVIKFVGVSGMGWILDFFTYTLLGFISTNLVINNIISSMVGVTLVFVFATRNIFWNNSRIPIKYKYVIYSLFQCILIFFISKLLNVVNVTIINHFEMELALKFSALISKTLVTPITMVLNFFVMKGVVEKL